MRINFLLYFCFTLIAYSSIYSKPILTETQKIEFLLNELDKPNSNLKFVRNGVEYSGKEAKMHMQKKLDYAGNKIKTVDDFINEIATKSYLTGNLYYIQFPDGTKMESAKWLRQTLKDIE
jgi:hypothetical protein